MRSERSSQPAGARPRAPRRGLPGALAGPALAGLAALGVAAACVTGLAGCTGSGGSHAQNAVGGGSGASASTAGISGRGPSNSGLGSGTASGAAAEAATPLQPLPTAVPAALRGFYQQKLSWHSCDGGFQCTTVKVPLDYAHPGGATLRLAVVRQPAQGGSGVKKLGPLLVNPGGPGGSAVQYAEYAARAYPAAVRQAYDIVGVDPRGVGASAPVSCLTDRQMDAYTRADETPDTSAETNALVAADTGFGKGCAQHSGPELGHVSTVESARDMDVVRAALGQSRLDYLGASYGTFLGATYAGLFPTHVGRMVLDGAMDPALSSYQLDLGQAAGFETAFRSFAADCAKRSGCPLGGSAAAAGPALDKLFAGLDAHPLPAGNGRTLTESLATTGVMAAMYDQTEWPQLRAALTEAKRGDGTGLIALSDEYYERDAKGHYSGLMAANMAVNCLDDAPAATGPAQVRAQLPAFEKASPEFGEVTAWMGLGCAGWPVATTGAPHTIAAQGAPPIVVVGTTRDPATPYAWAKALASQLSSGRLLSYDSDGHTAYNRGSSCIDDAVDTFLLRGTPPASGTTCR